MLAYLPLRSLATSIMLFYQGAAGAERVFNILDTESHIKENKAANNLKMTKGDVEFKNVTFAYPNTKDKAVKNVNGAILQCGGGNTVLTTYCASRGARC